MTKFREIAAIIYYDDKHNVYLQERGSSSTIGEKYAFWGGGLEPGETPTIALQREIMEELGHQQKDTDYFKFFIFDFPEHDIQLKIHIFLAPLDFDPILVKVTEGNGFYSANIEDVLKNPDMLEDQIKVLQEFKNYKNW